MRRILLVLALLCPAFAGAQNLVATTRYIADNGVVLDSALALQGYAEKKISHGVFIALWGSAGVDNKFEVDYMVGWRPAKYATLRVAYNNIHPMKQTNDVTQLTASVATPALKRAGHEVSGSLTYDYMLARKDSRVNSGGFTKVGIADLWTLPKGRTLDLSTSVLHDQGIFQGERGFVARTEVAYLWKVGEHSLGPKVRISKPFVSDRNTEIAVMFTATK